MWGQKKLWRSHMSVSCQINVLWFMIDFCFSILTESCLILFDWEHQIMFHLLSERKTKSCIQSDKVSVGFLLFLNLRNKNILFAMRVASVEVEPFVEVYGCILFPYKVLGLPGAGCHDGCAAAPPGELNGAWEAWGVLSTKNFLCAWRNLKLVPFTTNFSACTLDHFRKHFSSYSEKEFWLVLDSVEH